jgi:hypothetical protein
MHKHMKQQIVMSANRKILYLPHAIMRMSQPERMITTTEIREAVLCGEIIEQYPEDKRGASCLILYCKDKRPIHVVCAPKTKYLAIITAYLPAPDQWSSDFKVRN